MFRFADSDAKIMMVLASFFAFSAGGLIPVYCMYVGKANQFLTELTSVSEIEATINSTGTMFIYFGLGIFISMAISLILFFFAGEKQETAIRKAYLRALMRQEAAWYDFVSPA
jgi:ATP-binding cassette, subfamily B (MDR/TAP), member 1